MTVHEIGELAILATGIVVVLAFTFAFLWAITR